MTASLKPRQDRLIWDNRPLSKVLIGKLLGTDRHQVMALIDTGALRGQRISDVLRYCRENPHIETQDLESDG